MSERDAMNRSSPACPSEAVLDAYDLGELRSATWRTHIEACEFCQGKLRERREAFQAIPRRDELVRAIHVAVADSPRPRPGRRPWARLGSRALPLAASGVLTVLGVLVLQSASFDQGTRMKGTVGLTVYIERGGLVSEASSGTRFRPGDRLRFEVDLPTDSHLVIVGRESSGRQYNAFPVGTEAVGSSHMQRGVDQLLPGAVVLDESLGREVLYLVSCKQAFRSSDVRVHENGVQTPGGCLTAPFVLVKVDP